MLIRSNCVRAMEMTSINSAILLLATYKVINTNGLPESTTLLRMMNHTKDVVFVSFDGITDHDYLMNAHELEIATPLFPGESSSGFNRYTKIYVRGNPSIGRIYVMAYY